MNNHLDSMIGSYFEYYSQAWGGDDGESPLTRWTHRAIHDAEKAGKIARPLVFGVGHLADPVWIYQYALDQKFSHTTAGAMTPLLPLASDPRYAVEIVPVPSHLDSKISLPATRIYTSRKSAWVPVVGINDILRSRTTQLADALSSSTSLTPARNVTKPWRLFGNPIAGSTEWTRTVYEQFIDGFDSHHPPIKYNSWPSYSDLIRDFTDKVTPHSKCQQNDLARLLQDAGISQELTYANLPFEVALLAGGYDTVPNVSLCLIAGLCKQNNNPDDARQAWKINLDQTPKHTIEGQVVVRQGQSHWQTPKHTMGGVIAKLHEHQLDHLESQLRLYRSECEAAIGRLPSQTQKELWLALGLAEYFAYTRYDLDATAIIDTLAQPWLQIWH